MAPSWGSKWLLKAALLPAAVTAFRDDQLPLPSPFFHKQHKKSGLAVSSVSQERIVGDSSVQADGSVSVWLPSLHLQLDS